MAVVPQLLVCVKLKEGLAVPHCAYEPQRDITTKHKIKENLLSNEK
jgi:hypothetical protein